MASIESSSLLATIASLKKELLRLEEQVVAAGGTVSFSAESVKTKKAKKERDPDAPPPKENPYFAFLNGRLRPLLKEARADLPGTVPVAFAKHLLDSLAEGAPKTDVYDMESAAIIEAFEAWAADPEHLRAPPRKPKDESSDAGSVASGSSAPKERKKPAPMTEEAKAAKAAKAAATREANKAKKAAETAAAPAAADAAPAEAPKAEAPKKVFAKKAVSKPSYTLEQLQDFEEKEIDGETYGVNPRGDVVDGEGGYAGNWDGKVLNKAAPKPADWEKIMG